MTSAGETGVQLGLSGSVVLLGMQGAAIVHPFGQNLRS